MTEQSASAWIPIHTRKEVQDPSTGLVLQQDPEEAFGKEYQSYQPPKLAKEASFLGGARKFLVYNYPAKKFAFELLRSRIVRANPIYHWAYRRHMYGRMIELEKRPNIVQVENTTYCNQSCIFCPHSTMERTAGIMDLHLYKKIVDNAADMGVEHFGIVGLGEPMLDKFLPDRVKYAKYKGIRKVFTVSNLVALTPEKAERLVEAGLDFIGVSIDAAKPETYQKIHRSNFGVLKKNVKLLYDTKKRMGSRTPELEVRFRHQQANYDEIEDFKKQFAPISDNVTIYCMIHNWGGAVDNSGMSNYASMNTRYPCQQLWNSLYICWDGRVGLCCLDSECAVSLGDLRAQSLEDVWFGETLTNVRKLHLEGLYSKVGPCAGCTENEYYMQPWF